MTQTELAESIAEFMGWEWLLTGECKIHNKFIASHWCFEKHIIATNEQYPEIYFFSPDGSSAVWDKAKPKTIIFHDTQGAFNDPDKKIRCVLFDSKDKNSFEGYGPDRIKALCSAVHKMRMKK